MNQTMNLAPARNLQRIKILSDVNYCASLILTKVTVSARNFSLSKFVRTLLRALFCDKTCAVFCSLGILAMWVFVFLEDSRGVGFSSIAMMPWAIAFTVREMKKGGEL